MIALGDQRLPLRFWAKVRLDEATGCFRWVGALTGAGYGVLKLDGRTVYAHRLAYEVASGPVPEGRELDHVRARGCVHRDCCNPAHLEAVPHTVNVRRGVNSTKTHCPRGHEYTAANTYEQSANGHRKRKCRACHRDAERTRYQEVKRVG